MAKVKNLDAGISSLQLQAEDRGSILGPAKAELARLT